jgi:hypothetical protein
MEGASHSYSELLRLAGVKTRRIARITSDEEERLRLGYEIRTAYAYAAGPEGDRRVRTSYSVNGVPLVTGEVAPTATLWRFNLGWVRRKRQEVHGFNLNINTGIWGRSDQEPDDDPDEEDGTSKTTTGRQRVVPFVEDRRNALLLRFSSEIEPKVLMSLQFALKRGIETMYQVEPTELAVEPLPTPDDPRLLMFYESAEGGAGVLERLAVEQGAMAEAARAALAVCHFDQNGLDERHAPHAREACEAACYDCLRSYSNTRYHEILDRKLVRDLLLQLAACTTSVGAGSRSRAEQFAELRRTLDPGSSAEPEFLDFLEKFGLRPPDEAQKHIAEPPANPDFYYREAVACIYIDGRHHQYEHRKAQDAQSDRLLRDAGYERWCASQWRNRGK